MAKALRLRAVWQDGGPAQAGKAITVTTSTGATATLVQADGVTTMANPVTTVLVDGQARIDAFVSTAGRYRLTGPDGATKDVTVADSNVDPSADLPVVTGSRGGNAALTSLLSGLASKRVIIDNTTA